MKKEIRICGFGGQGVILAGFIIGKAASVFMNYNAVQSQSYGPEARGGAARSEVIISDEKIGYPRPTSVDLLVAMSQESFDTYRNDLRDDTVIVVDPDLVKKHEIGQPVYKIHAQRIAEELGNKIVTNIVMVGAATSIFKLLDPEAVRKAVLDSVPSRFKELNLKAFEKGLEAGKNALKGL
ncbi:MAG: 2-oxoacid:ferredoxin oxidoreductase subunit gamma [Thermoplasmata archaeon]|nr:MAG: 2-oxoacid:ferredoxin oxidoreductase subunit gamma [Thermoplasmata archaeon]RLF37464.1 MAG: 2-oxoacid:ferredoxin oxidoreductase subunit gamma [Thermoplasmata archaeon]RLF51818.1 MAG: 2-oxoacid:ferredoxin oxidoreductase subunit gamma [Thermoplasmata archaeon]